MIIPAYFLPFFFTGSTCATLIVLAAIALRITTMAFGPPGTAPSTQQQVVLGVDAQHLQVAHRDPVGAHVAAHAHALDDARRDTTRRQSSPGARWNIEPCDARPPREVVALDDALEALAAAGADDVDALAVGEDRRR